MVQSRARILERNKSSWSPEQFQFIISETRKKLYQLLLIFNNREITYIRFLFTFLKKKSLFGNEAKTTKKQQEKNAKKEQ
jgi:hypothetical protein